MLTDSYKYHLHLFRQKTKNGLGKKVLHLLFGLTILFIGVITALVYWQYKKEAPLRTQNEYLQLAIGGFSTTKQSISETLKSFQVAGTKTATLDSLKEASSSVIPSGFIILLEDIDKTIAKIESTQKVISAKKLELKKIDTPVKFASINRNVLSFYDETINTLDSSRKEQLFAKEILIAMGPALYLPTLTDETVWRLNNENQIKEYYQNKKTEIDTALASLSRLTTPQSFQSYYNAQVSYLTRLAQVSDNIIKTLSQDNDEDPENASQIEKAYQILTLAKKENEATAQKLLEERLMAFDLSRNLNLYEAVRVSQNSLEQKLTETYNQQPQIRDLKTPQFVVNFVKKLEPILNSLQIPSII